MKKWRIKEEEGFTRVYNEGGPMLSFNHGSGVRIIEADGFAFKDLNRNGILDPYEDWRLPVETRVKDLVSKMDIDSKLGLSLHDGMFIVMHLTEEAIKKNPFLRARLGLMSKTPDELAAADPTQPTKYHQELIYKDEMRFWLMSAVDGPDYAANFNNNIQRLAEGHKFGVPVFFSTNPRAFKDDHSDTSDNDVSCWPSNLGLGATFSPEIAKRMAETISKEYRAMGITLELGPQIDLASDPRWSRFSATYGSDPYLNADLARAVCDGFQSSCGDSEVEGGWGTESVLAMCKHWPGSTGEGGRESHDEFGKYTVYPGGHFDKHTMPWTDGAFRLEGPTGQCGAVMSCYDALWDIGGEDAELVGASFNKYAIDTLLRKENGFRGFVCTDFWITGNYVKERTFRPQVNAWGYTGVTPEERALKEWEAGVDQCGGTNEIEIMREAYKLALKKHGERWTNERINKIAERILTFGFRVGGFENPYRDPEDAKAFVGRGDFRALGMDAHRKSVVLLKNKGVIPFAKGKVFIADKYTGGVPDRSGNVDPVKCGKPFSAEFASRYFDVAEKPDDADCAIIFMDSPKSGAGFNHKENRYIPISIQYNEYTAANAREISVAGNYIDGVQENRSYRGNSVTTYNKYDLDNLMDTKKLMGGKPVIVILRCTNPTIPAEFEPWANAVFAVFTGTPYEVILEAVSGGFEPSGLLSFQMPESMDTVEAHFEDTPRDMIPYTDETGNKWDFAFGLNWNGVIDDDRVKKYR